MHTFVIDFDKDPNLGMTILEEAALLQLCVCVCTPRTVARRKVPSFCRTAIHHHYRVSYFSATRMSQFLAQDM